MRKAPVHHRGLSSFSVLNVPAASEAEPGLEWTLRQRHQEPALEHHEERERHANGYGGGLEEILAPDDQHEAENEDRRGDIDAETLHVDGAHRDAADQGDEHQAGDE